METLGVGSPFLFPPNQMLRLKTSLLLNVTVTLKASTCLGFLNFLNSISSLLFVVSAYLEILAPENVFFVCVYLYMSSQLSLQACGDSIIHPR